MYAINCAVFVLIWEQCAILKFESVNILHPLHVPNRSTSRFIELRETYSNGDGKKTGLFPGLLCYCYTIKKYKKLNLVSFAGRVVKKYAKLLDIIIIAKLSKIVFLSQICHGPDHLLNVLLEIMVFFIISTRLFSFTTK